MEQRSLGTSDLTVSVFGLGTMTFGAEADEATSHTMLDHYFDAGGRFIDTADVYTHGASEEIIGNWIVANAVRQDIVLATKARFRMGDGPDQQGAGRTHLSKAIDASLRRLRTDYVDLYQMHAWDPEVPIEETLGTLGQLVTAGKARHIGVSNYTSWQIERAVWTARRLDVGPIASLQPQYNLLAREIELEILPACIENGIGILPWSPLGGGWLTGKYSRRDRPTGTSRLGEDPNRGVEAYDRRNTDRTWRILDLVDRIAGDRRVPMSQVALNWLRNRPSVSSVLLGARTVAQLEDNLGALQWNPTDAEMAALTSVSAPGVPDYVQGFLHDYAGMTIWTDLGTAAD